MSESPEMGQILFGAPTGHYGMDELGDACLRHVLAEIARVFWNTHQREWDRYENPEIAGLEFRPYNWNEDDPLRDEPNLCLTDREVQIWWYKHPLRGTSVNRGMTAGDWFAWLNKTLAVIRAADLPYLR